MSFNKGKINIECKNQCDHSKTKSYLRSNINIGEINSISDITHIPPAFLKWNETTRHRIPKSKFVVNTQNLSCGLGSVSGTIIAAPNQPADKLTNKSERVKSKMGSILITRFNLAWFEFIVNWWLLSLAIFMPKIIPRLYRRIRYGRIVISRGKL